MKTTRKGLTKDESVNIKLNIFLNTSIETKEIQLVLKFF